MIGAIWIGALQAILFVALLALLCFAKLTARPTAEVFGMIEGVSGFHVLDRHADAEVIPGLVMFRFNGPLVFFNAGYFKREAQAAAHRHGDDLRWFVLDMIPLPRLDITGIDPLTELRADLAARGLEIVACGRHSEARRLASDVRHFPSKRKALQAYREHYPASDPV